MPPAARVGVDTAGGPILPGPNVTVFVGGSFWAVMGHTVTPHGPPPHGPPPPVMVKGSMTVFVSGIPACRLGDVASCGCPAAPGFPTVMAGG